MIRKYQVEREGQKDFYNSYLMLIDNTMTVDDIISDSNDGVIRGNLLEFKLIINDLNNVLFQSIKYSSAMRIKGKPIPANIILISLNDGKAYLYKSESYLADIEKVYIGAASKGNEGFRGKTPECVLDYVENSLDEKVLIDMLRQNNFTKVHIDDTNIVGWARFYYNQNPSARKADFIGDKTGKVKIVGEIRNPSVFKDYIYPYKGSSNVKFGYLMDKLNDDILKKNLGAFYTPQAYAKKSLELVRQAIARVPAGNDYIILDRCAGTGNLEIRLTDEELSHVILSTYEYYEYKVMLELLGDKVRYIIPPTEKDDTFQMGLVKGADALSKEYIDNPILNKYIKDQKVSIILFENPPYAETTSVEHQKKGIGRKSSSWKNSFVVQEMKKNVTGTASNDLGNAFIWSAFQYYLRQPTDSYIVFSPVKYWKAQKLIEKRFIRGFAFNRKHFHTNIEACIMCALWANEEANNLHEIQIDAYNITNNELIFNGTLDVKRIYSTYSEKYYDKRKFADDVRGGILAGFDGLEASTSVKKRFQPIQNQNILGYMVTDTSGFDNPDLHSHLLVAGAYNGNGFYLREDNYLEKLPMFAASRYITYNRAWTERGRIMKSADGRELFWKHVKSGILEQYLLRTLLFSVFEPKNHMRTFVSSDGKFYKNDLCLDCTNGETIAYRDLKALVCNEAENKLLDQWLVVFDCAKQTKEYDKNLTYGIYQISTELNTFYTDIETEELVYNYPALNGGLITLKSMVKEYYNTSIVPTLFDYEFLK